MNTKPVRKSTLGLELDLAFEGASKALLNEPMDASTRQRLTSEMPWQRDIICWINATRTNKNLCCQEIVRSANALSLGLQLTDDATITKLNARWRKKEEPTDVISFPALDEKIICPENRFIELGDIIISVTRARQQAKEHNHALIKELRWLVSHGLLHLLGWEHPNQESLNEMLSFQEQLITIDSIVQHND